MLCGIGDTDDWSRRMGGLRSAERQAGRAASRRAGRPSRGAVARRVGPLLRQRGRPVRRSPAGLGRLTPLLPGFCFGGRVGGRASPVTGCGLTASAGFAAPSSCPGRPERLFQPRLVDLDCVAPGALTPCPARPKARFPAGAARVNVRSGASMSATSIFSTPPYLVSQAHCRPHLVVSGGCVADPFGRAHANG